jgi:putative transposase
MLKRRGARPGDKWHLDEVFIRIRGEQHYLWQIDQNGNVLDILVQSRRNTKAAKRFFRKLDEEPAICTACDRYGQAEELRGRKARNPARS